VLWALAACAPEGGVALDARAVVLVDAAGWAPVGEDPLPDGRPAGAGCPVSTWGEEGGALEVQTGACAWLAVAQPAAVALSPGDRVEATIWHADLDAAEPGEGHVALWVGDEVLWEARVAIPHEPAV
jgi:hypothetical protein